MEAQDLTKNEACLCSCSFCADFGVVSIAHGGRIAPKFTYGTCPGLSHKLLAGEVSVLFLLALEVSTSCSNLNDGIVRVFDLW